MIVRGKTMYLKRKVYGELVKWKNNPNHMPLIVEGLRQVGKSYIVDKFAHDKYDNVIVFDFRKRKELRVIFDGDIDVDSIIRKASPYFPNETFIPNKTVLIFEEICDCPKARSSLKSFALDKRYDVIATGSLLGVLNYHRHIDKASIPTGYEQIIEMTSMDFEEFLWANGIKEELIDDLKHSIENFEELPSALETYYKEMIKRYIVVGGIPRAVVRFLETNNFSESRGVLADLIKEYRGDFGRFIDENSKESIDYKLQAQLNMIFDSIPNQLARENLNLKFKYSDIKQGGRAKEFELALDWLEKAGLILRCYGVKAIERPLMANVDKDTFKVFFADTGLLMAMYPITTSLELLNDQLDSRKGAIFENLAATMFKKSNMPLFYFNKSMEHLEIDFLIESKDGIVLFEEKSTNTKMAASRAVMSGQTPYKAYKCYKIIQTNYGKGDFYQTIPQCVVPFVLEKINNEFKKGVMLPKLEYPEV